MLCLQTYLCTQAVEAASSSLVVAVEAWVAYPWVGQGEEVVGQGEHLLVHGAFWEASAALVALTADDACLDQVVGAGWVGHSLEWQDQFFQLLLSACR